MQKRKNMTIDLTVIATCTEETIDTTPSAVDDDPLLLLFLLDDPIIDDIRMILIMITIVDTLDTIDLTTDHHPIITVIPVIITQATEM